MESRSDGTSFKIRVGKYKDLDFVALITSEWLIFELWMSLIWNTLQAYTTFLITISIIWSNVLIFLSLFIYYFRCDFLLLSKSTSCRPGRLPDRRLARDPGKKWHGIATVSGGGSRKRSRPSATASARLTERRSRRTWTVPWNKSKPWTLNVLFPFRMRTRDWLQCNSDFWFRPIRNLMLGQL